MKSLRILSIMGLLLLTTNMFAKTEWKDATVSYRGNEYIVTTGRYICSIKNKKYALQNGTETVLIPFEGESRLESFLRTKGEASTYARTA